MMTPAESDMKREKYTDEEKERIKNDLDKVLGPEYISSRPAAGNKPVQYIEGWKAISLANQIFGYNGWSSEVKNTQVDYVDDHGGSGRFSVGLSVIVRISLKDGTFHEDIGYGHIENAKSRAMAFEKCKKEAMTDALKRALRCFGSSLGNCLYDKAFLQKVNKFKVPPTDFDESQLLRHPDVLKRLPKPAPPPVIASSSTSNPSASLPMAPQLMNTPATASKFSNAVSYKGQSLQKNNQPPHSSNQPGIGSAGIINNRTSANSELIIQNRKNSIDQNTELARTAIVDELPEFSDSLMDSPISKKTASPVPNNDYLYSDDVLNELDDYDLSLLMNKVADKTIPVSENLSVPTTIMSNPNLKDDSIISRSSSATHSASKNKSEGISRSANDNIKGHINDRSEDAANQNIIQGLESNGTNEDMSAGPIGFFSASVAEAVQKNTPVPQEKRFNPKITSTFMKTTLDHSKSTPVKRGGVPINTVPSLSQKPVDSPRLSQKRSIGMPPNYKTGPQPKRYHRPE